MGAPQASKYYRNDRPVFRELVAACGQPPYARQFDGGRVRGAAEVQRDVAERLTPSLVRRFAKIVKGADAAPTDTVPPAEAGSSSPTATSLGAPLSIELDAALERGKVFVSDTEAIYDVSHAYFCVLRALYPDHESAITSIESSFQDAVFTIFDPDLYRDTDESRAARQRAITAVRAEAQGWAKLAQTEASIRRLLPRAQYSDGMTIDVVVNANLFAGANLSACFGASFRSSAVIDTYILATLNQMNGLVAMSLSGQGQLAVARLVAAARSAMDSNRRAAERKTIRDLVCIDQMMRALPQGATPTPTPTPTATATPSPTPTPAPSPTPAPTPTATPSPTPSPSPTPTNS